MIAVGTAYRRCRAAVGGPAAVTAPITALDSNGTRPSGPAPGQLGRPAMKAMRGRGGGEMAVMPTVIQDHLASARARHAPSWARRGTACAQTAGDDRGVTPAGSLARAQRRRTTCDRGPCSASQPEPLLIARSSGDPSSRLFSL